MCTFVALIIACSRPSFAVKKQAILILLVEYLLGEFPSLNRQAYRAAPEEQTGPKQQ